MKVTLEQAQKVYDKILEMYGKDDICLCEEWLPELKVVPREATIYIDCDPEFDDCYDYEEYKPVSYSEYREKRDKFVQWLTDKIREIKSEKAIRCLGMPGRFDDEFGPETVELITAKQAIEIAKRDGLYRDDLTLSTVTKRMERKLSVASFFDLFKETRAVHNNTPVEKYISIIPIKTFANIQECCKEEGINRQTLYSAIQRGTTVSKTGYKYRYKKDNQF